MSKIMTYGLPEMNDSDLPPMAREATTTAKVDLIRAFPFMGYLVMSTEIKFTMQVETMAATTIPHNRVFINPTFLLFVLKNRAQRAYVLAHEVMHIFLEHIGRQVASAYDPELWNIATDFAINNRLNDLASKHLEMPSFGLADSTKGTNFSGMSADEIYHKLLENAGGCPDTAKEQNGGGKAQQNGQGQGGDQQGDGEGNGGGEYNHQPGNAAGDFSEPRPFDVVSSETQSEASTQQNKQTISAALGENKESMKNMGTGAANLMREFEAMVEPVIPWTSLLADFMTESHKDRSTYNRVSRRSTGRVIFPTMTGNRINCLFGIDTSGSMGNDELQSAMSELKSIVENFDSWHLTLLSCDTNANLIGEYDSDDGDDWETLDKGLIGGGGTDMTPMVEYGNEMEEPPTVMVIITDGYIPTKNLDEAAEAEGIPTFIIVTKNGNDEVENELEHCRVVKMNDAA